MRQRSIRAFNERLQAKGKQQVAENAVAAVQFAQQTLTASVTRFQHPSEFSVTVVVVVVSAKMINGWLTETLRVRSDN